MQYPRILAIAGLAVGVLSCARTGPVRLRFDVGTTDEQRAAFEDVAPDWNAETLPEWQFVFNDDDIAARDVLVSFVDHIWIDGVDYTGRECTDEGENCARGSWIRVRRDLGPELTHRVARHELGHVLGGMHHLPEGQAGVMVEAAPGDEITDADRALCRAAVACPMIRARQIRSD